MAAELVNLETAAEDHFVHGMLENLGGNMLLAWTQVYLHLPPQALMVPEPSEGRGFNRQFVITQGPSVPKIR